MPTKICSKCKTELPETTEYFANNVSSNFPKGTYLRPECKKCTKKAGDGCREAKKLAGNPKTPPIGTPCDCCGRTDMKLCFDHDHETLAHRGWLCQNCNQGMGRLGDTIKSLLRAIEYMKGNKYQAT